jgi:hypothetical protein
MACENSSWQRRSGQNLSGGPRLGEVGTSSWKPDDHGKLRTMSRPKKIKTAIWIGEQQWQALKELADTLDRSAAQLLREANNGTQASDGAVLP